MPIDLIHVEDVHKRFPGVQALAGVDFQLRSGEVHALVGENGAGKSTLARTIAGIERPDAGGIWRRGTAWTPRDRSAAERGGVRLVMQELNLIPTLSVAENLFLDRLPGRLGFIDRSRLRHRAREVLDRLALRDIDPDTPAGRLGIGRQQMVEIASALARSFDVLILDEPTASLSPTETEILFRRIGEQRRRGAGVIYISHRLEELRRIADRVTVLRDGDVVATHAVAEVETDRLIAEMVGREAAHVESRARSAPGDVILRVEDLHRGDRVRGVSFELHRGEVLGFAGLVGAGRTETARALVGADRPDSGRVWLGEPLRRLRPRSPRAAVRRGLALLSEDRKGSGLLLDRSVRANITLADLPALSRGGWIRARLEREVAGRLARKLAVRCSSIEQPARSLSGGNQQKVVLARWLLHDCEALIFDEPTRGIDVGARAEIYRLLGDLAARGKALLVISSDLTELMAICDRIAVFSAGKLCATFQRGEWSEDAILRAALSEHVEAGAAPPEEGERDATTS